MESYYTDNSGEFEMRGEGTENVLAGAVGAFLFALAGGVVWVLLSRIGIVAGISGLIAVVCAIQGYRIFAKKESKTGMIISIIMAILVIVLAWYACLAWDFHDAVKEWYAEGEVDTTLTYFECLRGAYQLLGEGEIAKPYFIDLGLGLVFCVIASISYISTYSKKLKQEQTAQSNAGGDSAWSYTEVNNNADSANDDNNGSGGAEL